MTWAYSPSTATPLSVPQGIIGLMTRFGMESIWLIPKGTHSFPINNDLAGKQAKSGSFRVVNSMDEAFKDADIVYPRAVPTRSWAAPSSCAPTITLDSNLGSKARQQREVQELGVHRREDEVDQGWQGFYMHCLPGRYHRRLLQRRRSRCPVFERYRIEIESRLQALRHRGHDLTSRFKDVAFLEASEEGRPRVM